MRRMIGCAAAAALFLSGSLTARADLLVNGGFESGSLSPGWGGGNSVEPSGTFGIPSHSGTYFLAFGSVGGDSVTSQTVSDTVGQSYDLQFFYFRDGATPSDLNVRFDGVLIYSEVNSPAHGWVQHDFTVVGTGTDTVSFGARNDPAFDGLDDVSLNAIGAAVPEPTSAALLGIGIGFSFTGVCGWRLRKRLAIKAS
jgi:hypothetical protein